MRINTTMSIKEQNSNNSFGEAKGIIFHDYFLDKDTFIPLYKEYYSEKKTEIDTTVNNLLFLLT